LGICLRLGGWAAGRGGVGAFGRGVRCIRLHRGGHLPSLVVGQGVRPASHGRQRSPADEVYPSVVKEARFVSSGYGRLMAGTRGGALCRMGVWPMRLATSEVRTDGGAGRLGRGAWVEGMTGPLPRADREVGTGGLGGVGEWWRSGLAADREESPTFLHHSPRDRGPTCAPAGRSGVGRPAAVRPFPFWSPHFPVRISTFPARPCPRIRPPTPFAIGLAI
jgi:hypothetical protein